MREIDCLEITSVISNMISCANYNLPRDVISALSDSVNNETNRNAADILSNICENAKYAADKSIPICQDTGMVVVYAKIGQNVQIANGLFTDAVNAGVEIAYEKNYFRKSVVADPVQNRINTQTNAPAVIYTQLTEGDNIDLTVLIKGFGSENTSKIKMFNPTAAMDEITEFVVETVKNAGGNACPPMIIGVGMGGTFDYCAYLSKWALTREIGVHNPNYKALEMLMLDEINKTNIGPAGFGGRTTALWVAIEEYPTHIAGLPVAVNILCHASRHIKRRI